MHKKVLFGLVSVLVLGVMTTATSAFAVRWSPNEAPVELNSSNFVVTVTGEGGGKTGLECGSVTGTGKLGKNETDWETSGLTFSGCTFPMKSTSGWTAVAVSSTSADLKIPGESVRMIISDSPRCELLFGPVELGASGNYKNGTSAILDPSIWTLSGEIPVKDSPGNCFSKATKAEFDMTFNVLNTGLGATEPIDV